MDPSRSESWTKQQKNCSGPQIGYVGCKIGRLVRFALGNSRALVVARGVDEVPRCPPHRSGR